MKKITEKGKKLLELFEKIEGEKSRTDLLYQAETMLRAQEALKADYGLIGPDATLFNAAAGTLYADLRPVPVGTMKEAVNG